MNNVGYQSSSTYLALPDVLKTSFPSKEAQSLNVRAAPAPDFDAFIAPLLDINERNVDRSTWPIHHRWRAINTGLSAGLLHLSEVADGFQLEVEELPEGNTEKEMEADSSSDLPSGLPAEPATSLADVLAGKGYFGELTQAFMIAANSSQKKAEEHP